MALYAIGDLHLSLNADTNKSMSVFGAGWQDYVQRLAEGFSQLGPEDVIVLCGDLSWAMDLDEATEDFHFINRLPGEKIMLKGNHDYWWATAQKIKDFFEREHISTIKILHNNCHFYKDVAICGTRGWFWEEHGSRKVFDREVLRLRASLEAAGDREKICFLHYPPRYQGYICPEIIQTLEEYDVRRCFFGHLHGPSHRLAQCGLYHGIQYTLVSADYLRFQPLKIMD